VERWKDLAMTHLRSIDGDGHIMELMGTTLPDYLEEPYVSRMRADREVWQGMGATFAWLPSDCWDRNLGTTLFKGHGNRPDEWLAQLDAGPLDAAVLYPSFLLLIGAASDADWSVALCRAFNQWVADEFVAKGEGRLHAVGVLPPQDPEEAAKEVARVASLGLVAAMIPSDGPHLLGARPFDPCGGRPRRTASRSRCTRPARSSPGAARSRSSSRPTRSTTRHRCSGSSRA
jgi:hypothetical protein